MKLRPDEFEKLALEHQDMLFRVACRLTRDQNDAQDLVQDTYHRAWRAREEFDLQEYGIRPWLVRILHNLHFSNAQREKKQPVAMDEAALDLADPQSGDTGAAQAETVSFEGMDEQLVRALRDLPPEYQTVMLLWAVEEFTYQEISQAVDVPIGTVMSRLFRAKAKLAARLHDYAKKEGIIRE